MQDTNISNEHYLNNTHKRRSNIIVPKGFSRVRNDNDYQINKKLKKPIKIIGINNSTAEENKNISKDKRVSIRSNISKIYNSQSNYNNNEENELDENIINIMSKTNTTIDNINKDMKEVYLETMYKKASNKNFKNLKEDLIEYYENFKGVEINDDIELLKNR